jgi:hypothetical protein
VIALAASEALGRFTGRRPVRLLGVRAEFGSSLPVLVRGGGSFRSQ